jgi:hypothetical protein
MFGIESPCWRKPGSTKLCPRMSRFRARPVAAQPSGEPPRRDSRPAGNGNKSWRRKQFPCPLDAGCERDIWSFASPGGFVIRSPRAKDGFRLFLGSSAVEHSTVNRMVAGSNPARGARRDIRRLPQIFQKSTEVGADQAHMCLNALLGLGEPAAPNSPPPALA